jgi:NAD(P)-dependent dehydrogenase (short-subunit alcohol dehydrogenase family)
LDVLVNNAGVFLEVRQETQDGFEATFGVNHLAPFLLTHLLQPALAAASQGRIVNVSSAAHQGARLDLENLQRAGRYSGFAAYADSKLANVLFTRELARRLGRSSALTVNALHPGVIATKLLHAGFSGIGGDTLGVGAETSVFLATDPSVAKVTGRYFVRSHEAGVSPLAEDAQLARHLYDLSAELTGVPALAER